MSRYSVRPTLVRLLKSSAQILLVLLVTAVLFDVGAWLLAPRSIVQIFPDYQTGNDILTAAEDIALNGYYAPNADRGFDIAPQRKGFFSVDGHRFEAWSNSLGCFDRDWEQVPDGYHYFAGDSFAWGFAPYASKYATRFEALTSIPSLKCGVSNTGQLHQLSKFKDIAAKVGRYPRRVILSYYSNDVANDYGHPHGTVVSGCLINRVLLDKDMGLVRLDDAEIQAKTQQAMREQEVSRERLLARGWAWTALSTYSLSAHLLNRLSDIARGWLSGGEPLPDESRGLIPLAALEDRHHVPGGPFKYHNIGWADRNRAALRDWSEHARAHDYELFVVLIPPATRFSDTVFFAEVRQVLETLNLPHLDLAAEFRRRGLSEAELYWQHDQHFSQRGNEIVGQILAETIRR